MGFIDTLRKSLDESVQLALMDKLPSDTGDKNNMDLLKAFTGSGDMYRTALIDPYLTISQGGGGYGFYKPKYSYIANRTLRLMSLRDPFIVSIFNTRINQVTAFSRPQDNRHDTGFKFKPVDPNLKIQPGSAEEGEVKFLTDFILHCGRVDEHRHFPKKNAEGIEVGIEPMDFNTWLQLVTRDRLTFAYVTIETILDRMGSLYAFLPVSSENIYFANKQVDQKLIANLSVMNRKSVIEGSGQATSEEQAKDFKEKLSKGDFEYVQMIEDRVIAGFTRKDMIFKIAAPQNFIDSAGYPVPELEMAINTITTHLQADNHNSQMFVNGKASRGILHIQGEVPQQALQAFRCLGLDNIIMTDKGAYPLKDLIGIGKFNIWTGTKWAEAIACESGMKQKCIVRPLRTAPVITSPDHRFLTVNQDGNLEWKRAKELTLNDYVAINGQELENNNKEYQILHFTHDNYAIKNARENNYELTNKLIINENIAEWLGWVLSDGTIAYNPDPNKRKYYIETYYHPGHELYIRDRHCKILDENLVHYIKKDTVPAKNSKYSFKPRLAVFNKGLITALINEGFGGKSYGGSGKLFPKCIYNWPKSCQVAFLKGFFSGDGGNDGKNKIRLSQKSPFMVKGLRILLNHLGLTTIMHPTGFTIQDTEKFMKEIGFIQDYKNDVMPVYELQKHKYDLVPHSLACKIIKEIRNDDKKWLALSLYARCTLSRILNTHHNISIYLLKKYLPDTNYEELKYSYSKIKEITITDEQIPMGDIEVFDDAHMFVSNGIHLRNSQWHSQIIGHQNAWQTPVFAGAYPINWIPLNATNQDMEFSMYNDHLLRTLCAIFCISPLEIGFDYLTRGSQQKSMSESDNLWKIQDSHDRGLRPLLTFIENLINEDILPKLNAKLAKKYVFCFVGLDAESKMEEAQRQTMETQLHASMDDIRQEVQKDPVLCGKFPLNAQFGQLIFKLYKIGEIRERLLGEKGAADNPAYNYIADPFYFENLQLQMNMPTPGGAVGPDGQPLSSIEAKIVQYIESHPELMQQSLEKFLAKSDAGSAIGKRIDSIQEQHLKSYKEVEHDMMNEILVALKEDIVKPDKE